MAGRFSIEGVFSGKDNFSKILARVETNAGATMRRMRALSASTGSALAGGAAKLSEKLGSAVASLGKVGAMAGLAALTAGITRAVTVGGNLEQSLSSVAAVTGASGKDM